MSRTANPVAIGLFTLITLALAAVLVVMFSGNNWWSPRERYVLLYDSSIRGLNVGAPVTLKGVKIGQVIDTRVTLYGETRDILNTVTVEIDTSALEQQGNHKQVTIDELLQRGLRAQLRQQSLLTGLLYIDVDFEQTKPGHYKPVKTAYPQLPTTPTNLQQLTRDLETVDVNKLANDFQQTLSAINLLLNDPSMQQLAGNISNAVKALHVTAGQLRDVGQQLGSDYSHLAHSANTLLDKANRDMPQLMVKLDDTLAALQRSAENMDRFSANAAFLASDDSPALYRLNNAAKGINEAADQLRALSDLLERQPEVLLYGKPDKD